MMAIRIIEFAREVKTVAITGEVHYDAGGGLFFKLARHYITQSLARASQARQICVKHSGTRRILS